MMVHTKYFKQSQYSAGTNLSVMQKNLDYYNSEDCSHFVSETPTTVEMTELAFDAQYGPTNSLK